MKRKPKVDMPRQNREPKMFFLLLMESKRERVFDGREGQRRKLSCLSVVALLSPQGGSRDVRLACGTTHRGERERERESEEEKSPPRRKRKLLVRRRRRGDDGEE